MINPSKTDNPKKIAQKFSEKLYRRGFNLDFSLKSLEEEIDKILEDSIMKTSDEKEDLTDELTAYFGETLCEIFNASWIGSYYGPANPNGDNFYSCKIKSGDFIFGPNHFFRYYFSNGKENEGTFKNYLYKRDKSSGIFHDFLGGGIIKKLLTINKS